MSTIAIGDIHGNLTALTDLLGQIRGEVRRADTIVFLGDYMDRGPDTRGWTRDRHRYHCPRCVDRDTPAR